MPLMNTYKHIFLASNRWWIIGALLGFVLLLVQIVIWLIVYFSGNPMPQLLLISSVVVPIIVVPIAAWFLIDAAVIFNTNSSSLHNEKGLLSIEGLLEVGNSFFELAKRYEKSLSIVQMDLPGKPLEGDFLQMIETIVDTKRGSDLAAQTQVHRIVVVLPDTPSAGAMVFLDKIKRALLKCCSPMAESMQFKTISIDPYRPPHSLEEMLKKLALKEH